MLRCILFADVKNLRRCQLINWITFLLVVDVGLFLIFLQALAATYDGFLTHKQMTQVRGLLGGYSLVDHGGMWADTFLITQCVAYLMGKYSFAHFSLSGFGLLVAMFVVWILLFVKIYSPMGAKKPEAHVHHGRITPAGWIHILYAAPATWVILMTYLGMSTPRITNLDMIITSLVLTPWTILGVMKFNRYWHFDKTSMNQVIVTLVVIWAVTVWKVW